MKITSASSKNARGDSSPDTKQICTFLHVLRKLGLICDVSLRGYAGDNGSTNWRLTLASEVRDE